MPSQPKSKPKGRSSSASAQQLPSQLPDSIELDLQESQSQDKQTEIATNPTSAMETMLDRQSHRKQGVTLQEVVEQIMACWGGPAELARAFYDQYTVAKPGSMIRGRALEKMLELVRVYQQLYGKTDDIDDLDEAEARAELKTLMREINDA